MLHIGRCGSTVLANMLDQHPKIHWKGEFFNESNLPRYLNQYNTEDPFQALWFKSGAAKRRSFGFEIKSHPIQHPSNVDETVQSMIEACVYRLGCRHFILLTRAHLLRRFVSFLAGRERDQWNFRREKTVEKVKVQVPTNSFQFANHEATLLEFFDLFDGISERWKSVIPDECNTIELEYAHDILGHPEEAYQRVIRWLELEPWEAEIENRKVNKEPLPTLVKNWDEVCSMLAGTQYEWMLSGETCE